MFGGSKIFWALTGSIALHALITYCFWPRPPLLPARNHVVVHAQILQPFHQATSAVNPEPQTKPEEAPAQPSAQRASAAIPASSPPRASELPAQVASTPSSDQEGYLPIDAVDEPATPMGDWIIDTEVLPHGYTQRLVILVWISATGNVDKWVLDNQSGNKSYALKALVDLDRTALRPAMRNNIAVPSYRRLEIVMTHE